MSALVAPFAKNTLDPANLFHGGGPSFEGFFNNASDPAGFFLNTKGGMQDQQAQTIAQTQQAQRDALNPPAAAAQPDSPVLDNQMSASAVVASGVTKRTPGATQLLGD